MVPKFTLFKFPNYPDYHFWSAMLDLYQKYNPRLQTFQRQKLLFSRSGMTYHMIPLTNPF